MRYRLLVLLASIGFLASCQTTSPSASFLTSDHAAFNRWLDQQVEFVVSNANLWESLSALGSPVNDKDGFTIQWVLVSPSQRSTFPRQHLSRRDALRVIADRFDVIMRADVAPHDELDPNRSERIIIAICPRQGVKSHATAVQSTPTRADGAAGRD